MAHLSVFLFGSPRIQCNGTPVSFDTRKASALIAYLAVTCQQHSRDSLATLLWPDNDQPHARAALRRTLSTLNKALPGNWLDIDREIIGLDFHSDLQVDVHDFHSHLAECVTHGHSASETCLACVQPLTSAVALYRDDFLAGFTLRDSPNFDDWQFYQADSQRRELASALERLVHCYSALVNFDAAIVHARRWLAMDRLHEPAHRQLMLLYAWAGQRAAALHQYRECVQVLERELGVAPLEATTQIYQFIKENHTPPPPLQLQTPASSVEGEKARNHPPLTDTSLPTTTSGFPLVGRAAEWTALLKTYNSIDTGGRVIIIEGEAGIGKTRLAGEFLAYARNRGAKVIAARCYEGESHLAYGPIVSALRTVIAIQEMAPRLDAIPAASLSEAMRLLPELATLRPGLQPPLPLDSPGAQSRFFEGIRQLLLALCAGSPPGILFLDDLHWADEATLDLLSYLLRRLHEVPLCLVFTWRGKQLPRGSRLHQLFIEAQRTGRASVLSPPRLDQASVRALVQGVKASPVPGSLIEHLYAETEGIPFFLIEYLSAMEKGLLNTEHAPWSLPGGIRDLLHSRLNAVDEIGWQLLNTAAAIGRSFDFDTLREASGRSEEETVTALEKLIDQGLVEEVQHRTNEHLLTYDFSHEKLRELVYEESSLARRRLLHRRIAEVLVSHTRGQREIGPLAGHIARHYRLAGNDPAAAEYFKLAGEYARTLYANAEALTHLRLALALGHPNVTALHEAVGDLHTLTGEYNAALKSYETAAALCTSEALARIEHKLGAVYIRRGEWELAESHLEAALRASDAKEQASEQAGIYADWSLTAQRRGQLQQALELAQRALTLAEASHDTHALAQAHNILGILATGEGNPQEARHHLEQSLALAETLNDPAMRAAALNNLAQAYQSSGELERALVLTEAALKLCASQGDRHREAALHSNLADLLHAAGQSEAAMAHLKEAVSIYAEIGVEAGSVQPEIWKLSEW